MILENVYLLKLNGNGNGDGDGYGDGYGDGNGYGYGNGYGDGNGDGYGDGNGYGYGDGNGYGYGNGYGDGNGYGYGYGDGNGDGNGNGNGDGNGNGNGYGYGNYYAKLFGEWFEVSGEIENSLCINLPEDLYDKIDEKFIKKINNLESLRILRDKIGLERYISLLDAKMIHTDIDNNGYAMKLYKYVENGEDVIIYEGICPSTNRMYHMYPPNQKSKTCLEAKESTFENKKIAYRHGDLGLLNVNKQYTKPLSET